ncbi:MAG TPA: hypothetical protein P5114_08925 [Hyphomicrobiaceae bacterium]|nr:hypothetical protein [Hyphomicrobiaceae bacterium]
MHHDNLNLELAVALARLQSSFDALAATREKLGDTATTALVELTRQIDAIDASLNGEQSIFGCSRTMPTRTAA